MAFGGRGYKNFHLSKGTTRLPDRTRSVWTEEKEKTRGPLVGAGEISLEKKNKEEGQALAIDYLEKGE